LEDVLEACSFPLFAGSHNRILGIQVSINH